MRTGDSGSAISREGYRNPRASSTARMRAEQSTQCCETRLAALFVTRSASFYCEGTCGGGCPGADGGGVTGTGAVCAGGGAPGAGTCAGGGVLDAGSGAVDDGGSGAVGVTEVGSGGGAGNGATGIAGIAEGCPAGSAFGPTSGGAGPLGPPLGMNKSFSLSITLGGEAGHVDVPGNTRSRFSMRRRRSLITASTSA